jgi:zinc finger HIT domain-containing protein 1
MNNFGVIEVASARAKNAPGWAYIPDTGINPAVAALQPTNRKRARNQPTVSLSDLSARQEAKVRKELDALDRDSHKDFHIPIVAKSGTGRCKSPL